MLMKCYQLQPIKIFITQKLACSVKFVSSIDTCSIMMAGNHHCIVPSDANYIIIASSFTSDYHISNVKMAATSFVFVIKVLARFFIYFLSIYRNTIFPWMITHSYNLVALLKECTDLSSNVWNTVYRELNSR